MKQILLILFIAVGIIGCENSPENTHPAPDNNIFELINDTEYNVELEMYVAEQLDTTLHLAAGESVFFIEKDYINAQGKLVESLNWDMWTRKQHIWLEFNNERRTDVFLPKNTQRVVDKSNNCFWYVHITPEMYDAATPINAPAEE